MHNSLCLLPLLCLVGCTTAERQDVLQDLAPLAPKVAEDAAGGGIAGAISGAIGAVAAVGLAYITRKFIQKKYAKPTI